MTRGQHIHAVPRNKPARPGQCHWAYVWSGVLLRCDDDAIPGGPWLCAEHLIESLAEGAVTK